MSQDYAYWGAYYFHHILNVSECAETEQILDRQVIFKKCSEVVGIKTTTSL